MKKIVFVATKKIISKRKKRTIFTLPPSPYVVLLDKIWREKKSLQ